MLGNRTDEDNEQVDFILLYDNDGTLRSEILIKSYRACSIYLTVISCTTALPLTRSR